MTAVPSLTRATLSTPAGFKEHAHRATRPCSLRGPLAPGLIQRHTLIPVCANSSGFRLRHVKLPRSALERNSFGVSCSRRDVFVGELQATPDKWRKNHPPAIAFFLCRLWGCLGFRQARKLWFNHRNAAVKEWFQRLLPTPLPKNSRGESGELFVLG